MKVFLNYYYPKEPVLAALKCHTMSFDPEANSFGLTTASWIFTVWKILFCHIYWLGVAVSIRSWERFFSIWCQGHQLRGAVYEMKRFFFHRCGDKVLPTRKNSNHPDLASHCFVFASEFLRVFFIHFRACHTFSYDQISLIFFYYLELCGDTMCFFFFRHDYLAA